MDDANLIKAIRSGDRELYSILMDQHQDMVCNLCYRMTGDISISEEIAHDAFVEAYVKLGQLRDPGKFGGWVRQIALNLCRMWYRKNTHLHEELSEEILAVDDEETDSDIHALMALGLSNLAIIHRLVLVLHYFERFSYEEIAEFLDIPVGTVMSRLYRARNALKNSIEEIASDKKNEEFSMNMEEQFQQGVQAEIAVLIKMFQEQPGAMERLSLILERSPERLTQLIQQSEDKGILRNMAILLPRLSIPAIPMAVQSCFSLDKVEAHRARELLFYMIAKSEPQGMHRLNQMVSSDVYRVLDAVIQFQIDNKAKCVLFFELMEACDDRNAALLFACAMQCFPEEAFPILMAHFAGVVHQEDLYKPPYIIYALCRMGTRFCSALIGMLERENEPGLPIALAGAEGIALSVKAAEEKEYKSKKHLLNDIRIGMQTRKFPPLRKEDLDSDIFYKMINCVASFLHHQTADIRNKAIRILGLLRTEGFSKQIASLVSHPEESTRLASLLALANMENREASVLFINSAQNGTLEERFVAIEALGRLKIQESQSLLKDMVNDPDGRIQKAAVTALGEMGGEDVRAFLQDLLRSRKSQLRKIAAKALYRGAVYPTPLKKTKERQQMIRGSNQPFILNSMDAVMRFSLPEIREYDERELTRRIAGVCFDYSATRRDLMDEGLMTRSNGICELTEKGKAVWRVEHFIMDHYFREF